MKKLFIITCASLLCLTFSNRLTAQMASDTHRLIHVKFKADKVSEGMKIAKSYCQAYAAAGHRPTVFEFDGVDGKWDGIFILPLSAGLPENGDPHPKVVMQQLAEMLGEEVDLAQLHESFTAMIAELSIEDVREGKF